MLFLALVIYLVLFPVCYFLVQPLVIVYLDMGLLAWMGATLGMSLLISAFIGLFGSTLVHADDRNILASLVRPTGTRWIALLTLVICGGLAIAQGVWFQSVPWGWRAAYLLPVFVILALNFLHIEWSPSLFEWVSVPGKIILPEKFRRDQDHEFSSAYILRDLAWDFRDREYRISGFGIRRSVYEEASAEPRVMGIENWAKTYVENGLPGELRQLVRELYDAGMPFGSFKEVSFVLAFVQQIVEYTSDEGEYPKYPVETLAEGKGDCEDFSILGASLLALMGYHVALLHVPGHVALGVAGAADVPGVSVKHRGKQYFYCETTGESWKIGQLPEGVTPDQVGVLTVALESKHRISRKNEGETVTARE